MKNIFLDPHHIIKMTHLTVICLVIVKLSLYQRMTDLLQAFLYKEKSLAGMEQKLSFQFPNIWEGKEEKEKLSQSSIPIPQNSKVSFYYITFKIRQLTKLNKSL